MGARARAYLPRMTTHLTRAGLSLLALLVNCGGASSDYQPPALPPPPPPPPAVEPAPLPEPYGQAPPSTPGSGSEPVVTPPTPPQPPLTESGSANHGPAPAAQTAPSPPAAPPPAAAPPPSGLVYSYPTGQWVYTTGYGWIWVPADSATEDVDGVPYVHLYTPAYGWTWYVSPWGWGGYRYGIWARHPWHPPGWHGYWVAHPRVVVRLGPRYRRR
jgi:hypothetical protein